MDKEKEYWKDRAIIIFYMALQGIVTVPLGLTCALLDIISDYLEDALVFYKNIVISQSVRTRIECHNLDSMKRKAELAKEKTRKEREMNKNF